MRRTATLKHRWLTLRAGQRVYIEPALSHHMDIFWSATPIDGGRTEIVPHDSLDVDMGPQFGDWDPPQILSQFV